MKVEYINPFVTAAIDVFATMVQCKLTRGKPSLSTSNQPTLDISGVIGLSGMASGTVVLSFARDVAISATERLSGIRTHSINSDVRDAVGELTNIVAGRAKSQLNQFSLSLALPTVVTGKNHVISFGSATQTIRIPYSSDWGNVSLEVGLVEEVLQTSQH